MFIWEQPKYPSTEEQIHTHTHTHNIHIYIYIYTHTYIYIYIYTYNGILLSHKKNEILPFATTGMGLEGIMLSEVSQTEEDKYCMLSLICRI